MRFRKILGYDQIVFLSVWFLLFVAGRDRLFRDPGSFVHTVVGERIISTSKFPNTDTFSFTHFGDYWIAKQWLAECIMAIVHRLAGLDGLLVLTVSLLALLYSVLAFRIERSGMNLVLGSLVLAFSLAAASHNLHARPHIVTLLFMAVVFWLLVDIDMRQIPLWKLSFLVPIFMVWTNLHGGVLGGLLTLLLTVLGWTFAWWRGWRCPVRGSRWFSGIWIVTFFCFASTLVNPYGKALPISFIEIMGSRVTAELIEEHASIFTLIRRGDSTVLLTIILVFCLGLFYSAVLAGTDTKERRITWMIPMVWFFLSLARIRHAPIFSVLAVIAIAEMFPCCGWVETLEKKGLTTFRIRRYTRADAAPLWRRLVLPLMITVVSLVYFRGSASLPSTSQQWVRIDPGYWPVGVLPELKGIENGSPPGEPIFNDMLFGGFLMYHAPSLRIFIDDRCELYGDEFIVEYVRADRNDFDRWTSKYGVNLALIQSQSNYFRYFEDAPGWCAVKRCPAGVLYKRCESVANPSIDR